MRRERYRRRIAYAQGAHLYAESLLHARRHVAGEVGLADGAGGATLRGRLLYSGGLWG